MNTNNLIVIDAVNNKETNQGLKNIYQYNKKNWEDVFFNILKLVKLVFLWCNMGQNASKC